MPFSYTSTFFIARPVLYFGIKFLLFASLVILLSFCKPVKKNDVQNTNSTNSNTHDSSPKPLSQESDNTQDNNKVATHSALIEQIRLDDNPNSLFVLETNNRNPKYHLDKVNLNLEKDYFSKLLPIIAKTAKPEAKINFTTEQLENMMLAELYFRSKKYKESFELYSELVQEGIKSPKIYRRIFEIGLLTKDLEILEQVYPMLSETDKISPYVAIYEIQNAIKANDLLALEKGIQKLIHFARVIERELLQIFQVIDIYYDSDSALLLMSELEYKYSPRNNSLFGFVSFAYMQGKKWNEEYIDKRFSLFFDKDYPESTFYSVFQYYVSKKQFSKLENFAIKSWKKHANPDFLFELGYLLFQNNRFNNYGILLEKNISALSNNSNALNDLSYYYAEKGIKLDLAMEYIDKALALNIEKNEKWHMVDTKGWVLYKKGKYKLALTLFNKAYKNQKNAETASHIIKSLIALKQTKKARIKLSSFIKDFPKNKILQQLQDELVR